MRYTVVWAQRAEAELATIWANAEDRGAVASAADTFDTVLRDDPDTKGESRHARFRILFVPPLGVDFEVFEEDRLVRVLSVWRANK